MCAPKANIRPCEVDLPSESTDFFHWLFLFSFLIQTVLCCVFIFSTNKLLLTYIRVDIKVE